MRARLFCIIVLAFMAVNIHAAGRLRALCTREDGSRYFTQKLDANCRTNFLEEGWANFRFAETFIVDLLPENIVREPDGAKLWTQFFFAQPIPSEDGTWRYDYVKSISKFYCGKRQTRLIQATYVLAGKRVYERSSAEAIVEEIEPGTVNEDLYKYVCKK
jgi:hypothetical protein